SGLTWRSKLDRISQRVKIGSARLNMPSLNAMSDNLTPEDRRRTMQAVKSKKTAPERRLRAFLAGSGYHGWRLNCKDIQGNPDVAFPEQKIAIFVDGCFWHGCPVCNRPLPRANHDY